MNPVTTGTGVDPARVTATFERLFELLRRLTPDSTSLTAASTLRRLDLLGDHRLSDLAIAEGVTQPAMTQLVSRMERGGLVARAGDQTDGRVVVVRVTEAGRDLVRRRRHVRTARLADLLTDLSPADRAAIIAALPALDRLSGSAPRSTAG
jgi:DNA-binding MarR family transcriptional regulator